MSTVYEIPVGRGKAFMSDVSRAIDLIVGGWQLNQSTQIQSGFPFNVNYRNAGQDRDTGPNRPDLVGDPTGPQTRQMWFNATAIGESGSAFADPRAELSVTGAQRAARAGVLANRRLPVQEHRVRRDEPLEIRIEAVNIFNHVNLGFPDSEVGVPGTPNRMPAGSPKPPSATRPSAQLPVRVEVVF